MLPKWTSKSARPAPLCGRLRYRWTRRWANLEKGKADTELARVTAQRYATLSAQGIISRQEHDRYQSQYQSLTAGE